MKLLDRISLSPLRFAGHLALATMLMPLCQAEDAAKMPPIKVDPSPLPQVAGTITTFAPVVEKVAPSVVTISTSKMVKRGADAQNPMFNDPTFRRFFGIPDEEEATPPGNRRRGGGGGGENKRKQSIGLGSGVIVSAEGHILTNNHVIDGADEILVTIGNEKHEYKAKKIGTDPSTDIAVLKIEANNLRPIVFADSDKLRVGDLAIAVGNPFGLTQSVTMGIVSAVGRGGTGITDYENFIQTDASINPGNSGGALVDTEGRLIGINTAIFSRSGGNQGIGFAVPANLAHSVMEGIMKSGRVSRGYLGIGLDAVNDDLVKQLNLPSTDGAVVTQVEPGSPSEKAGIEAYDVVISVNGRKVEGPRELRLFVASLAPGTKAEVTVLRDGKEKSITVTLAERPAPKIAGNTPDDQNSKEPDVLDGVTVGDIDADARKKFDVPDTIKRGVVVMSIDDDSPSADAGIRVGDVILDINRTPVTDAKQAVELSEKLKKEKKVLLRVASKGGTRLLVVERKD
jgi:serine protease Do